MLLAQPWSSWPDSVLHRQLNTTPHTVGHKYKRSFIRGKTRLRSRIEPQSSSLIPVDRHLPQTLASFVFEFIVMLSYSGCWLFRRELINNGGHVLGWRKEMVKCYTQPGQVPASDESKQEETQEGSQAAEAASPASSEPAATESKPAEETTSTEVPVEAWYTCQWTRHFLRETSWRNLGNAKSNHLAICQFRTGTSADTWNESYSWHHPLQYFLCGMQTMKVEDNGVPGNGWIYKRFLRACFGKCDRSWNIVRSVRNEFICFDSLQPNHLQHMITIMMMDDWFLRKCVSSTCTSTPWRLRVR